MQQQQQAQPQPQPPAAVPTFKLILTGESGVGKTSLFMRVKEGVFRSEAKPGVEFCTTEVDVDGVRVKLSIWDTAGVERFRTLTRNYYKHCHGALLTCSLDDKSSLDNLHRWNHEVDFYCKECTKTVVANKSDLNRAITQEQLLNFASTFDCKLIATVSAKTGDGVLAMLTDAARQLLAARQPLQVVRAGGAAECQQQQTADDSGGGEKQHRSTPSVELRGGYDEQQAGQQQSRRCCTSS